MKKIATQSLEPGMIELVELFNEILEQSDYNLNKYVNGRSLSVPDDDGIFEDNLKKFVNSVPEKIKELEDSEKFWNLFDELDDYNNNDKFINWMRGYTESVIRPFIEAEYIRKMDAEKFNNMTNYCFENMVLKSVGDDEIDLTVGNSKELFTMKKVLFTFIDMVIVNNYSKENAINNMKKVFGIKESYCGIWWELIEKYEDKLWKIMIMKKCERIDNKLEYVMNAIEELKVNN